MVKQSTSAPQRFTRSHADMAVKAERDSATYGHMCDIIDGDRMVDLVNMATLDVGYVIPLWYLNGQVLTSPR